MAMCATDCRRLRVENFTYPWLIPNVYNLVDSFNLLILPSHFCSPCRTFFSFCWSSLICSCCFVSFLATFPRRVNSLLIASRTLHFCRTHLFHCLSSQSNFACNATVSLGWWTENSSFISLYFTSASWPTHYTPGRRRAAEQKCSLYLTLKMVKTFCEALLIWFALGKSATQISVVIIFIIERVHTKTHRRIERQEGMQVSSVLTQISICTWRYL